MFKLYFLFSILEKSAEWKLLKYKYKSKFLSADTPSQMKYFMINPNLNIYLHKSQ